MGEGDLKELRELVEFLRASGIAEFDMERPELKVRLKFAAVPGEGASATSEGSVDLAMLRRLLVPSVEMSAHAPLTSSSESVNAAPIVAPDEPRTEAADEDAGLHIVKSPLVGLFYAASSPGADPFVRIGDTVSTDTVLCIVEAMKIMNEIESDASGEVVKVFARAGQPVEYGQRLFGIRVSH